MTHPKKEENSPQLIKLHNLTSKFKKSGLTEK